MFDRSNKICVPDLVSVIPENSVKSFKKIRQARKKNRLERHLKKAQLLRQKKSGQAAPSRGPTPETRAKLTPDPLVQFKKKNILDDEQIWAFQRIRRAIQIITDGTQVRISRFNGVAVQTSRFHSQTESEFDIKITDHYTNWVDRMARENLQVGPVLDIIIDEMSLRAVDRKRGRRKGWAKGHLQASLTLYRNFSPSSNRGK